MKKKIQIMSNYHKCFNYIFESRKFIYLGIFIFLIFFILAILFNAPDSIQKIINELIKKIISSFIGADYLEVIARIFVNNLLAAGVAIVLGIVLGLFPILSAAANGYILGYVCRKTFLASASGFFGEAWKLLIYGVFELAAIFISIGLGIRLGITLFNNKGDNNFLKAFLSSIYVFFLIILPLLLLAAFIEGSLIFWMK